MKPIETRPVEQQDGSIKNVSPTCSESCFTAPSQGMSVCECEHYLILFHVRERKLEEFCGKETGLKPDVFADHSTED